MSPQISLVFSLPFFQPKCKLNLVFLSHLELVQLLGETMKTSGSSSFVLRHE